MLKYIPVIVLIALLAACSPAADNYEAAPQNDDTTTTEDTASTETDTTTTDNSTSDDPEASTYSIVITGAEEFEFSYSPLYGCTEDAVMITTMTQAPKLDIYLPANIQPGTYPLADFDANANPTYAEGVAVISITGSITDDGYDFYYKNVDGELVIETVPTQAGEGFVATLKGTLDDNDGDTITVDGTFNLLDDMIMGCEY